MAAIKCEICGGNLVMKSEGYSECSSCGMQYSLEYIKNKVQANGNKVTNNNTAAQGHNQNDVREQDKQNYLKLAYNAHDSHNYVDLQKYSEKVLEIDSECSEAYWLHSMAVCMECSTSVEGIDNLKISKMLSCFGNAVDKAPKADKKALSKKAFSEIHNFIKTYITKWADDRSNVLACSEIFSSRAAEFMDSYSNVEGSIKNVISKDEYAAFVAAAVTDVEEKHRKMYFPDKDSLKDMFDMKRMENFSDGAIKVLETAISIAPNDYEQNIKRYKELIKINKFCLDARSLDDSPHYNFTTGKTDYYDKISDESRARRSSLNKQYTSDIKKLETALNKKKEQDQLLKEKAAEEKAAVYWSEHPEEKKELDQYKSYLEREIKSLKEKLSSLSKKKEVEEIRKVINSYTAQKSSLGLFKVKEKKEIQNKIDTLNESLKKAEEKTDSEIISVKTQISKLVCDLNDTQKSLLRMK